MTNLLEQMLNKLTGAYCKDPDSNIGKLFQIFSSGLTSVDTTLETISLWRDIDNAAGTTLDKIGQNFGVRREGTSDPIYRLLIKTKVRGMLAGGDVDTIIATTGALFGVDASDIELEELYPAKFRVIVDETNMATEYMEFSAVASAVVKRIAAAGIGCEVVFYIPIGCEVHSGIAVHETATEQYSLGKEI